MNLKIPVMLRKGAIVAHAVLAIAAGRSLGAQERDDTTYYRVFGRTAPELRESMNASRPTGSDGKRYDARTAWHVRWKYRTFASATHCDVTSFDVSRDVVTTLPTWANEAGASPPLVAKWRAYRAALMVHEAGHMAIAAEAAEAIRKAGARMRSQPNCSEVARTVAETGNGLLAQYLQKDRQYDADTNHGQVQGARFP